MDPAAITIMIANAVLVLVASWPLARYLVRARPGSRGVAAWTLALWGVYLAEGVAFSASMATNVLNFGLAPVWGVVFGRKFRSLPREKAKRLSLWVSVYTCLPAVSFLSVFVLLVVGGWPVLTTEGGRRFGIPEFVPWPASTLLGFFLIVVGSAFVVKTAVTIGVAMWIWRRSQVTAL